MAYLRSFWQVRTPTTADGIANKAYVDSAIQLAIAQALVGGNSGLGGGLLRGHTPTVISHTSATAVTIDYLANQVFRIEATHSISGFAYANIPDGVTDLIIQIINVSDVDDITVNFGGAASTILEDELASPVELLPGESMEVQGREWLT